MSQQKFENSDDKYRMLITAMTDALMVVDAETRQILEVNKACESLYGYSMDEFLQLSLDDITAELRATKESIQHILRDIYHQIPVRYHKKRDGTVFPVEISACTYTWNERQVLCGIIKDITYRKQAEETLIRSGQRFKELADLLPQTVFEVDLEGNFLYANQAGLEVSGYTQDDIVAGLHVFQLIVPEDRQKLRENIEQVLQGVSSRGNEYTAVRKDGATFPVIIYSSLIRRQDKPIGIRGIVFDISELKNAQIALQQSEERYRLIMDNTDTLFAITSFTMNPVYHYIGPSHKKILGYEPEEMLGKSALNFVHPKDLTNLLPLLRTYVQKKVKLLSSEQTDVSETFQFRFRHKSGEWRYLESTANAVGDELLFVTHDITERRKVESALRKSEEQFRTLTENAPIGIYYNDFTGKFLYGNRKAEEIIGYEKDELIEKNFFEANLLKKRDLPKALKVLALNRFGKSTGPEEFTLIRKDGTERTVEIMTEVISVSGKKMVLGMVHDLTERRIMEAERRKLEEQLYQSQKMESIGRLVGGLAHDFNNILTAIMGYAELLSVHYGEQETYEARASKAIFQGTQKAAKLTNQLLSYARRGKFNPKLLNINTMIKDTLKVVEKIFEKNIHVVVELDKDISLVEADENQMDQVVTNILINAKDAMPNGGTLTIRTDNVSVSKEDIQQYQGITSGQYVRIQILDTGTGISPEVQEQMFEPFFTTKERGVGTGLGLSTVYGILKRHNGNIYVSSAEGEGTTMTIFLPASGKKLQAVEKAELKLVKSKGTILVIDDEEAVQNVVKDQLEMLGYEVLQALNGEKGVGLFQEAHREIDAVLLDIIMPGLSSRETLQQLRSINPDVRVLLISGYSDDDRVKNLRDIGAMGFLHKPFKVGELAKSIAEIMQ